MKGGEPKNAGGSRLTVSVSICDPVPVAFVAVIVMLDVPVAVGVPVIAPAIVSMLSPAGSPRAPKLVGLLVAVT